MSKGKKRRVRIWSLIFVGLLVVSGGVLWMTDNLPLGSAVAENAASDSTSVAEATVDEDENNKTDEEEVVAVPVELARAERRGIASYYKAASVIEADGRKMLTASS